jgi:hypothetical protein
MNEYFSEDDLAFREMLDDELAEMVNSGPGRYTQKAVEGAKNELKRREDDRAAAENNPQVAEGSPQMAEGSSQVVENSLQVMAGEAHPPAPVTSEPDGRLYSAGQIGLATFLGAPIAGCLLLARNYELLENKKAAWQLLGVGIGATIVLLIIAFLLPENTRGTGLSLGSCIGMYFTAKHLQGDTVERHLKAGGRKGSWGLTVALGLICAVIIIGLLFAVGITVELVSPSDAPIAKVRVSQAGQIELDGTRVTPERLRTALSSLAEDGGEIWYYRERMMEPMSEEASKAFKIVLDAGLTFRISSKPDFSDYIDSEGRSVPVR